MTEQKNSRAITDDWLEAALVADAREHRADYFDDDGFTARVMTALPEPATLPSWRMPVLLLLWTSAAIGTVFLLPGLASDVIREALRLFGTHPITLSGIATGLVALGAATWAAAVMVLRSDD